MTIAGGRSAGLGGGDAALKSHSLGELFRKRSLRLPRAIRSQCCVGACTTVKTDVTQYSGLIGSIMRLAQIN
jgi:hypothetical protein